MATYIWRGTWTAKGMENIHDLPQRYELAQNAFKSAGAELKDLYITMGTDDWTGIVEAPNEDAMLKALLTIAGTGMAKSQTMSAVHIARALDILKELD
jgi:uncharacterized protein with GYD domain